MKLSQVLFRLPHSLGVTQKNKHLPHGSALGLELLNIGFGAFQGAAVSPKRLSPRRLIQLRLDFV